jgi:AraC-like DNA-binding protein
MNKQHKLDSLYEMPLVIENETKHRLNQIFDELFNARTTLKEYACCYNVLDLVLSLSTYSPHKCSQGISLAVSYMMEHYNLALSIKELSKIANTSEPNFYATFKKHYGVSPISYLNHYRLSLAESMLLDGNDSISEIAYQVGITDPLYFSRLFKKTFGLSPKEYKKTYNENKE